MANDLNKLRHKLTAQEVKLLQQILNHVKISGRGAFLPPKDDKTGEDKKSDI